MCGIAGILSKDGENVVPLLRDMLESIKHRGPDGVGIVASGKSAEAGQQPIWTGILFKALQLWGIVGWR